MKSPRALQPLNLTPIKSQSPKPESTSVISKTVRRSRHGGEMRGRKTGRSIGFGWLTGDFLEGRIQQSYFLREVSRGLKGAEKGPNRSIKGLEGLKRGLKGHEGMLELV